MYDGLFSFCSLTYSREFVKKYQMTRVEIPKNGFNGKLAEVETHERFITKKKETHERLYRKLLHSLS